MVFKGEMLLGTYVAISTIIERRSLSDLTTNYSFIYKD
jgi:hypothetical protein